MSEYMTGSDAKLFHSMRESGHLSIFRVSQCLVCKGETMKGTIFCSKKCFQTGKELGMTGNKKWDEVMARLIGHKVKVETLDGVYLEGKLSSIETRTVTINDEDVLLPITIQMDNDQEKVIDIPRLKKITAMEVSDG